METGKGLSGRLVELMRRVVFALMHGIKCRVASLQRMFIYVALRTIVLSVLLWAFLLAALSFSGGVFVSCELNISGSDIWESQGQRLLGGA